MDGERDLAQLLSDLGPVLSPQRYSFVTAADPALPSGAFALVREDEGLTLVEPDAEGAWARISIGAFSSLEAVGLTAVLSARLSEAGISVNVIAALNHDHLFVPWERREEAMECLRSTDPNPISAAAD